MALSVSYANFSTVGFVTILVYVHRFQMMCAEHLLSDISYHSIIIVASVDAIKYLNDKVLSKTDLAPVNGVTALKMETSKPIFLSPLPGTCMYPQKIAQCMMTHFSVCAQPHWPRFLTPAHPHQLFRMVLCHPCLLQLSPNEVFIYFHRHF